MKQVDLPIGFRFVNRGLVYEVCKCEDGSCRECSFFYRDEATCTLLDCEYPLACADGFRSDHQYVVFKQVGEVSDETA